MSAVGCHEAGGGRAIIVVGLEQRYAGHRPSTIDDLLMHTCGKVLDQFGLDHDLYRRWTG